MKKKKFKKYKKNCNKALNKIVNIIEILSDNNDEHARKIETLTIKIRTLEHLTGNNDIQDNSQ